VTETHWQVGVSFLRTPFAEISSRIDAIERRGWSVEHHGDPWVVSFSKSLPDDVGEPETELREIMGDDWLDANEIARLVGSRSQLG
jgi:hypothetical protein